MHIKEAQTSQVGWSFKFQKFFFFVLLCFWIVSFWSFHLSTVDVVRDLNFKMIIVVISNDNLPQS